MADEYALKRWKHPRTGERRVYINAPGLKAKVWLTQAGTTCRIKHQCTDVMDLGNIVYENQYNGKPMLLVLTEVVRRAVMDYLGYEEGEIALSDLPWETVWQNALED